MADNPIPHFHNDAGVEKIFVGSKKFQCIGASSPLDHPHIFIDMGRDTQIVCPYCSTLFVHDANLAPDACIPPENKVTT